MQKDKKQSVIDAALKGLDFYSRHQQKIKWDANYGRFPFFFDCDKGESITLSGNWTTAIMVNAFLTGYSFTDKQDYYDAAQRGIEYIKTLQLFGPNEEMHYGAFREETPRTPMCHPRDSLTAALALLDWYQISGDDDAFTRAMLFAEWFLKVAMRNGYPYWTVRFDNEPWNPEWSGSFHSGSAIFCYRVFLLTNDKRYLRAMQIILEHYNKKHLAGDGRITVIRDLKTDESLDGHADSKYSNRGWEMMHVYNDDFGALANLIKWKHDGDEQCRNAAERFLNRMIDEQCGDGGFGPEDNSIPSAAGTVLIELIAANKLGLKICDQICLDRIVEYILNNQFNKQGSASDGAFLGMDGSYEVSKSVSNIRSGAYSIMGLLQYAGVKTPHYSCNIELCSRRGV